jgi:two-component system, cell cycle sensor histidine kinase PleC
MTEKNGSKGVLVVDDEPQILTSIRDLLEDDFLVSTAKDAETALRLLEQQEVAVILSDQRMPGMTGDEFLKKAKELSQATRVLITGYSDIQALMRAVNNGQIYAYVAKPWDSEEFKITVIRAAEHYHMAREVYDSEQRFRSLFEEAPIGYVEIDKDTAITAVNRAATTLLGYSHSELSARHFWELMDPQSRKARQHTIFESTGTAATGVIEQGFVRRDGDLIAVELHRSPIRNQAGDVAGLRAAMLDITARKAAEQTAEKYGTQLAAKNKELEQALQRAKEATAIKSQFLAKMSHELRTPLNGIIGLSELMYDGATGEVSPQQREYLGDVLASSMHLLALVNDLLDLEKMASGKMEFSTEAVDPELLLKEVRDVLRPSANEKKISVALEIVSRLPRLFTDPIRLKQVLYNYLSNAIKFTSDGGSVLVRVVDEGDEKFRLEVTDTGPGIAPADIPALFSDFRQLDVTRKAPCQGAGLGLALTKRLVEAQGGTVGVRSTLGEGSTFHAVLPNRMATERHDRCGGG